MKIQRSILISFFYLTLNSINLEAQLSGVFTVPGTYSTIAAAISDLNTQGVNGAVTINVAANYTETCIAGGYSLTATGTSVNPIVFQKSGSGSNPIVFSYVGVGTPSTNIQDGFWRLIGSDYVTIDGIDLIDNNIVNPQTMEFGYGLFKSSPSDGCQCDTIKNCNITLKVINNDLGIGMAANGSRGIDVVNALPSSHTTAIIITSPTGSNSNNNFYSNTIQKCNVGISLMGFIDVNPYQNADQKNEIGGPLAVKGNTIVNFGGSSTATNIAMGINANAQYSLNISCNYINSNTSASSTGDHPVDIFAIYFNSVIDADIAITNNTLSVKGLPTASVVTAIEGVSTNSVCNTNIKINRNYIYDCWYTKFNAGGEFYGIRNRANAGNLSIDSNAINSMNIQSNFNPLYGIYNNGYVNSITSISSNKISNIYTSYFQLSDLIGIYSDGTSGTLTVNSNTMQSLNFDAFGKWGNYMFISISTGGNLNSINSNVLRNISVPTMGSFTFIYNSGLAINSLVSGNYISGTFNKTANGNAIYGYYSNKSGLNGTTNISGNDFSNVTGFQYTKFYGIYQSSDSTQIVTINSNTISNVGGLHEPITGISLSRGNTLSSIKNNIISNLSCAAGGTNAPVTGIHLGEFFPVGDVSVQTNTISSINSLNVKPIYGIKLTGGYKVDIFKNKICDLNQQSGSVQDGIRGIELVNQTAKSSTSIHNNYIGNLIAPSVVSPNGIIGININSSSGNSFYSLFYNTIYFENYHTSLGPFGSSGIYQSVSSTDNLEMRNNIIINKSNAIGTGLSVAFRRSGVSMSTYSLSSNNNIFYVVPSSTANLVYYDGLNSCSTLTSYKTLAVPRDSSSFFEDTPFLTKVPVSTNYLHIDPLLTSYAESGAKNILGIQDDYDFDIRQGNPGYTGSGTAPDIGADEYNLSSIPCSTVSGGTISPIAMNKCIDSTASFSSIGYSTGVGTVYQWQVSNVSGGPYSNVVSGVGANNISYLTNTLSPGIYYYVLQSSCPSTSLSAISNEATVTIYPIPSVTITATPSPSVCLGNSITLVASGANTYTWSSGPISNSVVLSPTVSSGYNYTVYASYTTACNSTGSISVSFNPLPNINATLSNSVICLGQTTNLNVTGGITYTWSTGSNSSSVIVSPSVTTTYSVSGENSNGCLNTDSITLIVNSCTGLTGSIFINNFINIFPNPNNGEFALILNSIPEKSFLEIYNSIGQAILRKPLVESTTKIDLKEHANGIYFVKLTDNGQQFFISKIIKE
jgi:hypothetical protein